MLKPPLSFLGRRKRGDTPAQLYNATTVASIG
jgi:hypothetical protein